LVVVKLNYQKPQNFVFYSSKNDNKPLNHQHLSNQCVFIKFKVTVFFAIICFKTLAITVFLFLALL